VPGIGRLASQECAHLFYTSLLNLAHPLAARGRGRPEILCESIQNKDSAFFAFEPVYQSSCHRIGQDMDPQLGGRMDRSMLHLYVSQRLIHQLRTKDQYRALISTIHRVTDLVSLANAIDQSRIGIGNDRHSPVM
jgi:hypothetical protein